MSREKEKITAQTPQALLLPKERVDVVELPEIVELYFERADQPGKTVRIRIPINQPFEVAVAKAARLLEYRNTRVGVLGGSTPIAITGKTVGQVIRETNSITFQIASAELLGQTKPTTKNQNQRKPKKMVGTTGDATW